MALRLLLQGRGSSVKTSVHNQKLGFLGLLNNSFAAHPPSPCPPSSTLCNFHSHVSSVPIPIMGDVIKTQDDAMFCGGTGIYKGGDKDDWIITLAQFAVQKHNQNQNAHLKFVRVVGASHTLASSLLYHITLEATDARKQKIYHVVVWLLLWKNLMELLVWKPVHDALSAVGVKRGDLILHEAVMLYLNPKKKDLFPI